MFETIYTARVTSQQFLIMASIALVSGLAYSWLISFRIRSTRRYFVLITFMPFIVGMVLTFINGSIGAGLAFGGAFAGPRSGRLAAGAHRLLGLKHPGPASGAERRA